MRRLSLALLSALMAGPASAEQGLPPHSGPDGGTDRHPSEERLMRDNPDDQGYQALVESELQALIEEKLRKDFPDAFAKADKNGDGKLDPAERRAFMRYFHEEDIAFAFKQASVAGDNKLDFDQFQVALKLLGDKQVPPPPPPRQGRGPAEDGPHGKGKMEVRLLLRRRMGRHSHAESQP